MTRKVPIERGGNCSLAGYQLGWDKFIPLLTDEILGRFTLSQIIMWSILSSQMRRASNVLRGCIVFLGDALSSIRRDISCCEFSYFPCLRPRHTTWWSEYIPDLLPRSYRGRDAHYWAPPAQIRTCGLPAYGSYLGCLTAKRTLGQGCRIRGLGSHSSASRVIRSHVVSSFWLRRRSVRRHRAMTWRRKVASARLLVGTAW